MMPNEIWDNLPAGVAQVITTNFAVACAAAGLPCLSLDQLRQECGSAVVVAIAGEKTWDRASRVRLLTHVWKRCTDIAEGRVVP